MGGTWPKREKEPSAPSGQLQPLEQFLRVWPRTEIPRLKVGKGSHLGHSDSVLDPEVLLQ